METTHICLCASPLPLPLRHRGDYHSEFWCNPFPFKNTSVYEYEYMFKYYSISFCFLKFYKNHIKINISSETCAFLPLTSCFHGSPSLYVTVVHFWRGRVLWVALQREYKGPVWFQWSHLRASAWFSVQASTAAATGAATGQSALGGSESMGAAWGSGATASLVWARNKLCVESIRSGVLSQNNLVCLSFLLLPAWNDFCYDVLIQFIFYTGNW